MNKEKGFTLIELLVVIAIIGILAGIVVVSVRTAPSKAQDARIISALNQTRSVAAEILAEYGSYSNLCASGRINTNLSGDIGEELRAIAPEFSNAESCFTATTPDNAYCVSAPLKGGGYWCVDSKGYSKKYTTNPCTISNIKCE